MVHLLSTPSEEPLRLLQGLVEHNVRLTHGEIASPAEYHVLVAGRPEPAHLDASPDLRTLIIPWAGLPRKTRPLLKKYPQLAVHNIHHNAIATAEMAVTLLLAAAKHIVPLDRALRQHDWSPRYEPFPTTLLDGRTALILGYGTIGQRVDRILRAFGMKVIATRRSGPSATDPIKVYPPDQLLTILPQADVLVICLPLTPETEGLIGTREFTMLPPGAILVNVGRADIVEEEALFDALTHGVLAAAGLDVWYNYPESADARQSTPPSAYPFHEMDQVVLSPHRAGTLGNRQSEILRMRALAQLINAAARGEPMPNRVDVDRGY